MTALNRAFTLDSCAREAFDEHGFVVLREALSTSWVNTVALRVGELVKSVEELRGKAPLRDSYDRAFTRLMNVWQHDDVARAAVMDVALARIAAKLLRVNGVRLSHDTAFYKPPGAPTTPIHADQWHWPVSNDSTVTAWIPLQRTDIIHGPIVYYAGSCRMSKSQRAELCDSPEEVAEQFFAGGHYRQVTETFAIGDLSLHRGWTFHAALPNRSMKSRGVLTIVYMDSTIKLVAPRGSVPFQAVTQNWCPGLTVGDVLASEMNPLLFEEQDSAPSGDGHTEQSRP